MSKFRRDIPPRKGLKVLDSKYIVKTSENYRGLPYGDIIATWQNWLLSENPDEQQYGDILFLRGNIGYHQSDSSYLTLLLRYLKGWRSSFQLLLLTLLWATPIKVRSSIVKYT